MADKTDPKVKPGAAHYSDEHPYLPRPVRKVSSDERPHPKALHQPERFAQPDPHEQVQPVRVDGTNRRSDHDAIQGYLVDIVEGEYKGRTGEYIETVEHDSKDGYPSRVIVRTRDEFYELIAVDYKHVRPSNGREATSAVLTSQEGPW